MTGRSSDLDAVEAAGKPGHSDAEENASKCKNERQFRKAESSSHVEKWGPFLTAVAPFLCVPDPGNAGFRAVSS
jgi:hypothetical protein